MSAPAPARPTGAERVRARGRTREVGRRGRLPARASGVDRWAMERFALLADLSSSRRGVRSGPRCLTGLSACGPPCRAAVPPCPGRLARRPCAGGSVAQDRRRVEVFVLCGAFWVPRLLRQREMDWPRCWSQMLERDGVPVPGTDPTERGRICSGPGSAPTAPAAPPTSSSSAGERWVQNSGHSYYRFHVAVIDPKGHAAHTRFAR
jgi:hypothetical protein